MNFQRISLLFAQLIILINLLVDIVHPVEEDCYRGELYDYDNPCYGQPGQPEKLDLCPQGHKLVERCTESCKVCDSETFADSFNNCPSCKPCLTECPKGQVIIRNCSSDANAECGCPLCQEHDPSTCPPVLPCICEPSTPFPAQTTDWNMSTRLMATSGPGEEQNFASCHQYWIPLAVVIIVILVAAVIILGRCVYLFKASARYEVLQQGGVEMGNRRGMETQEDTTGGDANVTSEDASTPAQDQKGPSMAPLAAEEGDFKDSGQYNSNTHTKGATEESTSGAEAFEEHQEEHPLLEGDSEDVNVTRLQEELDKKNKEIERLLQSQQEAKDKIKKLEEKNKEQEENLNILQEETQKKGAQIEEIKSQLAEKDKKVMTKMQEDLNKKDEEIQLIQSHLEEERQKSDELEQKVQELEGNQSKSQEETQEREAHIQEIKHQLAEKDKKVANLEEDLNKKDEEIQLLQRQVEEMQKESPNLSPEAGLRPSQSDRGVISQSGKVDQLKPDSVERQKSVSSRNNMEATFLYLSKELSEEWRGVGIRLGLTNAELNTIKSDSGSVRNAIYQMLLHWKQVNGSGARYETLMEALESESRRDLADDLRSGKAFQTSSKQSS